MRTSPLHDFFEQAGASFENRYGVKTPASLSSSAEEYAMVRDAAALSDASHMQMFRLPEASAIDALDPLLAGNVARTRFGRMLHTFLADDNGFVVADCYVANNDDEFILLCESIEDDMAIRDFFMSHCRNAGIEDLSETHALMSLDGCSAWSVARDLFGPEIPGLPYLSVENCSFDGTPIRVFRAGKTSEFGYLAMVPRATASALATAMAKSLSRHKGGLCGSAIHNDLRLEGRFFNIHAEGAIVRDPLPLGLQWMIDLGKPDFRGAHAIFSRRAAGLKNKIAGILASPSRVPAKGELVYDGNHAKGRVVASCFSHNLGLNIGLALLDIDVAYAGLVFRLGPAAGDEIKTMAMPPIMPKSLSVKLDAL